ncbi:YbjN domain-containing protein [Amphiplicatus metriothermophilus]|uniref:Putative sensory transduction regulator n=1 Tax=Amphiplicatus metriothermophilus TaxID=1519374 RepID=A0A239PQF8_9PROT|nr:YbjN domain-containing protein [Amphiplicatus metriothermophilus]MBB5518697.1 hypothetical protein [Amphiplicatus metriothermophilus]SNT72146.1 Putative sensory transduction regulator [Amphiplicatus metriothermophilus]
MRTFFGALIAAALVFSPLCQAAAGGVSKGQIADLLSDQGYSVREDFQPNAIAVFVGDHVVVVAIDGPDGDISYITYPPGVSIRQVGHEFLSRFNSEVKFGRAYVDRDGDIAIQMDRNAAGGVSLANVESDFDVFLLLISKFLSDLESRAASA